MEVFCCPFCSFKADSNYAIMYHLESLHPEGESPFIVKNHFDRVGHLSVMSKPANNTEDGMEFLDCPRVSCGEVIQLNELENHLSLHEIEDGNGDTSSQNSNRPENDQAAVSDHEINFDAMIPTALRNLGGTSHLDSSSSSGRQSKSMGGWRELLNMANSRHEPRAPHETTKLHRRLGKSELGPHAHEKQMPTWLRQLLEADGRAKTTNEILRTGELAKVKIIENQVSGVIPVIELLLNQDPLTQYAYICHPCVQHVSKLRKEGGFCGYRNIQMLASFIVGAESQGFEHFGGKLPTIFEIQDSIEHAWDLGINTQGRLETGGIRGTRKYIGTPEAQAMLISLDIACNAQGIRGKGDFPAEHLLLQQVEEYYGSGCLNPKSKVRSTMLGPLYFQHPGHSMTIIGLERKTDGTTNLLVFDPMFHNSTEIVKLVGKKFIHKCPSDLLRAYRRSVKYLRKYNEFEIMKLTPPNRGTN